jgi:hypothetical protein
VKSQLNVCVWGGFVLIGVSIALRKGYMPPLYMIERNFAEQIQPTPEIAAAIKQVNADIGFNWLFSFLSADKKKTYCLYEAENPEAIREAARRLNLPADVIIEVGEVPGGSKATNWSLLR